MGMRGPLFKKITQSKTVTEHHTKRGPSAHRMLCVCAGPLRPHNENPYPSTSLTSLMFMAFSLASRTSGRSAVCV